jgi:hypothetical protein
LKATAAGFTQIERSHDFFWCTAAAIWNTRAELEGLRVVAPKITQADLEARFAAGSGLGGSNVVTAIDRYTWPEQLEELGRLRLMVLFAYFEGWLDAVAVELSITSNLRAAWSKRMIVPSKWQAALAELGLSPVMCDLDAGCSSHHYELGPNLGEAIVCLRYFKEIRNAIVHSGACVTTRVLASQSDYEASIAVHGLWSRYKPPVFVPARTVGEAIHVDHYGIIGLTGLVQRVMVSLDRRILKTDAGEAEYLAAWEKRYGRGRVMPGDGTKRVRALVRLAGNLGPTPTAVVPLFEAKLRSSGLIVY